MKNKMKSILALLLFSVVGAFAQSGDVGIGTTSPDASAALDITSTTKGLLTPRMTEAQRNAIATPANGLLVYQTDAATGFYFYDGTTWKPFTGSDKFVDGTNPLDAVYTAGNVGIGTTTPNTSALLDLSSTTKGLLIPQMTTAQMEAIVSPPNGLAIWNTSAGGDLLFNIGTATTPNWASSWNLSAGYSMYSKFTMGLTTNGGGYFSTSGLQYSGAGSSGYTYPTGYGTAGGYIFSDGGSFNITTFAPGSGNASFAKQNAFTVANNGNVGIGIQTALTPFHIKAATSTATDVQEFRMASAGNNAASKVGFKQRIGFYGREEYSSDEFYSAGIEVLYGDNIHIPSFPGRSSTNLLFLTGDRELGAATERMRIDYNGNVGIGTITPTEKLDVVGSIKMMDGNQGVGKILVSDADGKATWTNATTALSGTADLTNDAWIENAGNTVISTGNVGIGTLAPEQLLHLYKNDAASFAGLAIDNAAAGGNKWGIASIGDGFGENSNQLGFGNFSAGYWTMVIKNNGNVGIGTSDAGAKLDVIGSTSFPIASRFVALGNGTSDNYGVIGIASTTTTGRNIGVWGFAENGSNNYGIWSSGNTALNGKVYLQQPGDDLNTTTPVYGFGVSGAQTNYGAWATHAFYNGGKTIPTMIIDGSGGDSKVGIGTAAPTVMLEVNGAIKVGDQTTTTSAPTAGMIRFNSSTNTFEGYNGTTWVTF